MKLKPTIYAQLLIDSASSVIPSSAEGSQHSVSASTQLAGIAKRFWYLLQKNNQYKDLAKILAEVEVEYAKKEGKTLARVFSEKALPDAEITEIKQKLSLRGVGLATRQSNNIIVSNIIKKNWGGVTVEVDDKIIDLSSKGKIEKLKQTLSG